MDSPTLFNPATHSHLIPSLASLHAECIISPPYMVAHFLPPFDEAQMISWWEARSQEVTAGTRDIILQFSPEGEVVGIVSLWKPFAQTAPFKGYVEKLLVSPAWRQKGIAKRMMEMLEGIARKKGRGLLMIDTEKGSPGEVIYPKMGYILVGEIPRSEISPSDGSLRDALLLYKDMR